MAEDPDDNFIQAKVLRWLKTEDFRELCFCAEVEEAPTAKWFRTIVTESPSEASRLAGRLQDMLMKHDVCDADREREKLMRIEYRAAMGLKLGKKDHEYLSQTGKLDESIEARRRRLAERGMLQET